LRLRCSSSPPSQHRRASRAGSGDIPGCNAA
jgi:hypothetical protein